MALVHGSSFGSQMRAERPLHEVTAHEVPEAEPVQACEVPIWVPHSPGLLANGGFSPAAAPTARVGSPDP